MSEGMEIVKVARDELLGVLKKNREEHREIFLEALKGFRQAALEALEERIAEARKGKKITLQFRLYEPKDQTKDYDRIIRMLEMSQDEIIELTEREFAHYVMDDWDWMDQFLHSNMGYSKAANRKWIKNNPDG